MAIARPTKREFKIITSWRKEIYLDFIESLKFWYAEGNFKF